MQGYGGIQGVVDITWESKKGYPSQTPQKDNWRSVVVRLVKSFVLSEGARLAGYCERLPRTVIRPPLDFHEEAVLDSSSALKSHMQTVDGN